MKTKDKMTSSKFIGIPRMRIVSRCCEVESEPHFAIAPHITSERGPVYFTCCKCGEQCENKLVHVGMQDNNET